jgi:transcriptional regulator with PAS, ATPase and Fis domain
MLVSDEKELNQHDEGRTCLKTEEKNGFDRLIHTSLVMRNLIALARKVAVTDAVILITGESGTGKELFAQGIHDSSPRAKGPFIAINCAAMPDSLLEAELFGHQKGAFTGAVATRAGKFELADGGTLFLDEIGDMSLAAQAKILRALQEKTVQRVGGNQVIPVDIRIVCATHKKLTEEVRKGNFRQDLYYRLNEVNIDIPPLRQREEDLEPLIRYFIKIYSDRYKKNVHAISPAAFEILKRHTWPGNIRELEHLIHHSILMSDGETIWVEHIPSAALTQSLFLRGGDEMDSGPVEFLSLDEMESHHLKRVLKHTNWNKTKAAKILQVSRPTLDRKIDKYLLKRE